MKIKLEKIKFGTPYKMSGNINEIFEEKSVFPFEIWKFDNEEHLENIIKYLYNIPKKDYNDETYDNVYIDEKYFVTGSSREKHFEETLKKYKKISYKKLRHQIFYIYSDNENIIKEDLITIAKQIEIYYKVIQKKAENVTYVFHFNQDAPHVHVIFETE
jgi:hypothetical protein